MPFILRPRIDKVLDFHHVKFANAEQEVPGVYFVPEPFTDLGNTKWQFAGCRGQDIVEIDKNALRRLGA